MTPTEEPRPDKVPPSRSGRSWIASAMLVILLIAIGLGVLRANVLVGSLFLASAAAALVWIVFEARRRKVAGRPMEFEDGVRTFAFSLGRIFLVLVAATIAFFATCFPIGLATMEGESAGKLGFLAWVVGGVSAIVVGAFVAHLLRRSYRKPEAKDGSKGEEP
jgi:membrane protease YdiL (CAAX protease family)